MNSRVAVTKLGFALICLARCFSAHRAAKEEGYRQRHEMPEGAPFKGA